MNRVSPTPAKTLPNRPINNGWVTAPSCDHFLLSRSNRTWARRSSDSRWRFHFLGFIGLRSRIQDLLQKQPVRRRTERGFSQWQARRLVQQRGEIIQPDAALRGADGTAC